MTIILLYADTAVPIKRFFQPGKITYIKDY